MNYSPDPPGTHIIRTKNLEGITHIYNYKSSGDGFPSIPLRTVEINPSTIMHSNIQKTLIRALKESI